MPLAFTYPLMKRFTLIGLNYFWELHLTMVLILGWTAIKGQIDIVPIMFYLGAIFWTLGYDTIYGYQDIKDDEIIGLKSTSIKFKGNEKNFLFICYAFLLILVFNWEVHCMEFNNIYYFLTIIPFLHLFFYQIRVFKSKNPESCLKIFKSNNVFGLIIFLNILIIKNI